MNYGISGYKGCKPDKHVISTERNQTQWIEKSSFASGAFGTFVWIKIENQSRKSNRPSV